MYPRVMFPVKDYNTFDSEICHFKFKKPTYAVEKTNMKFFNEKPTNSCWFDLYIKELNCSIHFSYSPIDNKNTIDNLITDAFVLVAKHNVKAEYRNEKVIKNKNGVNGLLFEIEGPVASPINFYMTDSINHFVRASVYFNSTVNPDSIAPVLDFISTDVEEILRTFKFN
ncbi:MAG: hypothetical protein V3V14_13080 [Saprospiraceae bacterium]